MYDFFTCAHIQIFFVEITIKMKTIARKPLMIKIRILFFITFRKRQTERQTRVVGPWLKFG